VIQKNVASTWRSHLQRNLEARIGQRLGRPVDLANRWNVPVRLLCINRGLKNRGLKPIG